MKCSISTFELKANGIEQPLGLGTKQLFFSWKIASDLRAQTQTAYRVVVSLDRENPWSLEQNVWDSGKTDSSETLAISYAGRDLQSGCRYYWAVMVWDKQGAASEWSCIQWFETALFLKSDWQGYWIGGKKQESNLKNSIWIWHSNKACEQVLFYRTFDIPQNIGIKQAWFDGTADSLFSLYVNKSTVAKSNPEWGQDYHSPFCWIDFADLLQTGANTICCEAYKEGGNGGFIGNFRILLSDGSERIINTDESWQVIENPDLSGKTFEGFGIPSVHASAVGSYGEKPWGAISRRGSAPLLRREFSAAKEIACARLYICGLGYYQLTINGSKPDDNLFNPAYTQFSKRVYYVTYDVTELLQKGTNCIGVELGRGYYSCGNDWIGSGDWCDEPKLLFQMNILYNDGTKSCIVSDDKWLTADGPTFDDSIWYGEKYNANLEKAGWDKPKYDCTGWSPVSLASEPLGSVETCLVPPIKVSETVSCQLTGSPNPACYVYDVGKTTAGWIRITVNAPKNTRIKITYGEHLHENGLLDIWKDGCDGQFWETPQVDYYICSGCGEESWEPRFSYKGFRYIQIQSIAEPCGVEAKVFHNSVSKTGDFSCSNELFNQIHQMVCNSVLNNLHSIPTDTPMHEKRGWTGDAQVIADCACMNFDMLHFFSKWVQDIEDTQDDTGSVSHTCPGPIQNAPTPAWMSALILIPWTLYQYYGDKSTMSRHYSAFQKYLGYEISRLQDNVSSDKYYGDWCTPDGIKGPEGSALFATLYVYRACDIMSDISEVLGFHKDTVYYSSIAKNIRKTVNTRFFDSEKAIYHTEIDCGYRQTSNVLPLAFGVVPQEKIKTVSENLAQDVMVTRNGHLSTGCFATKYLALVLTESGHGDAASVIANQHTFPSWGYWLDNGATACLEGWSMDVRSYDHYFLGTIEDWFYEYVAGIKPLEPGFRKIQIKPYPDDKTDYAKTSLNTVYGNVSSSWRRAGQKFTLGVSIPANTSANVYVPAAFESNVFESNIPAENAQGVTDAGFSDGFHLYQIQSGTYRFEVVSS